MVEPSLQPYFLREWNDGVEPLIPSILPNRCLELNSLLLCEPTYVCIFMI